MGVLVRDGKGRMQDGANAYRIPGHPDLRVEPFYDDPDDPYDGKHARAHLYMWAVVDERFTKGLDKYRRWYVIGYPTLAEVRRWVVAGGPDIWNPANRIDDVKWKPLPPDLIGDLDA
jgi:hypothetical protein